MELFDDPYRACEDGRCNHDLARAVSVSELLGDDGPFPPSFLVVNLSTSRGATLVDDAGHPAHPARRAS